MDLDLGGPNAGIESELLRGLQGNHLGAGDDGLAVGPSITDQRCLGWQCDDIKNNLGAVDNIGGGMPVSRRPARPPCRWA